MPASHTVNAPIEPPTYNIPKNGSDQRVHVLKEKDEHVLVRYVDLDKRMDEWRIKTELSPEYVSATPSNPPTRAGRPSKKRKRASETPGPSASPPPETPMDLDEPAATIELTEEEYDLEHHRKLNQTRNFEYVFFREWKIKTWYFSPYPLTETEEPEYLAGLSPTTAASTWAKQGNGRSLLPRGHNHGRTSDLFAGGLIRTGDNPTLYVCGKCFKYMTDATQYELHLKACQIKKPPGKQVYHRGAHSIWEIDGAVERLYCQNLSLFGKLFIDIKTLYFDLDNFYFYVMTDATSVEDHVLGFFSKEKVSYDDYNLACILTFPPYQKMGYGMLLIEFSYELSRRAGKVGTPERPLSDLGLRSYLAYWVAAILRFLRRVLTIVPQNTRLITQGTFFNGERPIIKRMADIVENSLSRDLRKVEKIKKIAKGYDGEKETSPAIEEAMDDEVFHARQMVTKNVQKGASVVTGVVLKCSLTDIARATNLRIEDAAFALNEVGMLAKTLRIKAPKEGDPFAEVDSVVLSREIIEEIARVRKLKPPCLERQYVMLPETREKEDVQ